MDISTSSYAPLLLVLSFALFLLICESTPQDLKTYIVYTGNSMKDEASALSLYTSMLEEVADSNNEPKSVLHHYKRSFGGFVAKLTEEEADRMAGLDGVISVFPNEKNQLHTTRSWNFIGFPLQVERAANASNLIIGVIDTGIWPESESFNDVGFGPPPSKWKGSCERTNFACNKYVLRESSVNTFDMKGKFYPLIYGGDVTRTCSAGALNKNLTEGKIVLCDGRSNGAGPFYAEAAGALTSGDALRDTPIPFALPGSYLSRQDGEHVLAYSLYTSSPTATIFRSDEVKDTLAPLVASFSSRGPNPITPEILKPDLIAPGVSIIAAWPPPAPPSGVSGDERKLHFNVRSGTSMACPHVAGAATYVKSFHPTWSPAAIRSALMTTTKQLNPAFNREAEFGYGAGQIDPIKAVNPGLVYDASEIDYVRFLCGQGYSSREIRILTRDNTTCSTGTDYGTARDLNYPSFALQVTPPNVRGSFKRTVTNVGSPRSTYRATVFAAQGLRITVNPSVLSFSSLGQKASFVLTIEGTLNAFGAAASLV